MERPTRKKWSLEIAKIKETHGRAQFVPVSGSVREKVGEQKQRRCRSAAETKEKSVTSKEEEEEEKEKESKSATKDEARRAVQHAARSAGGLRPVCKPAGE